MNRLYGLIGFPLGHSFSARYFTEKFQRENLSGYEYRNFPLESIRELPAMLENHPGLLGFNVTIPYKQEVIPFLTALSAEAREIGAVNCVKITPQGLYGHNTDAYGFRKSLLGRRWAMCSASWALLIRRSRAAAGPAGFVTGN